MDLQEYLERAAATDNLGNDEHAIQVALFGVAGEAGSVVSEAKKWLRGGQTLPGLSDRVSEELGDLLWYVALTARRMGLDLNDIAEQNLEKTAALWTSRMPPLAAYDDHPHESQKLLRHMTVEFAEDRSAEMPVVRMIPLGELAERVARHKQRKQSLDQVGDALDDNSAVDDGYRYHDVIHLGHAAVLGWSPVMRSLMGAKRKDVDGCDRVEDGARAIAIEEGMAAFVFNYLEPSGFAADAIDWDLFKHVRRTVRGLEVADQPMVAWRSAYTQTFEILKRLRATAGGVVECDLDSRELRLLQ